MSDAVYDYAVLGGGCAGLSLAVALSGPRFGGRRVLLVEPRTRFPRDRTWCYWDVARHPFEEAVDRSWSRWALRHEGRVHEHRSDRYRYCQIPADAYTRIALSRLASRSHVALRLGQRALGIEESGGLVTVETESGAVRARRVFDGRPQRRPERPTLLQHFVGLRVRCERPSFDPDCVTLMDFDVSQRDGIHFLYVLPQSPTRALVEATYFSPQVLPADRYRDSIDRYLASRFGLRDYAVEGSEKGVLPMDAAPIPRAPSSRVTRIGASGGLLRPSTGYAFLAIQRDTEELARRMLRDDTARPAAPRSRTSRWLDAVFLSYLRRHPERAPTIFSALFERVSPDALVRFLADVPSAADRLAVMTALPTRPFAREAWRVGLSEARAS